MFRTTLLLTILFLTGFPGMTHARPDDDDIKIEADDVTSENKKPPPKDATPPEKDDEEEKDDIELEAERVTKAKQVDELEAPVNPESFDTNIERPNRKTSYFGFELTAGPRGGLLDLSANHGLGVDVNPVFKLGKNFALAINLNFGALFNSDAEMLQTLSVHLEPRIYIPFKTESKDPVDPNKGVVEGFISIKGGYFTQNTMIDDTRKKLGGVGLGMGVGADWFLNKNLKATFQFTYYFPYWLEECNDYSGQRHCSDTKVVGHLYSLTAGIGILF